MDSDREDYAEWKSAVEAYCRIEPRNFDDRVKLASAAVALSGSYIGNLYKLPQRVMYAIFAERTRLHESWQEGRKARLEPDTTNAPLSPPSSIIATPPRTPSPDRLTTLSWDCVDSGSVDLLAVKDCIPDFAEVPSGLVGHTFVHHDQVAGDDELFKIVDCISSHLRGTSFEVQFVDCGDSTIMVPESELLDMVRDSMVCWKSL
ncbi:hypothetical protein F5887DRAFT_914934 [Amanita rubescens]|nr:hypothetical protein F5887DRAFT_914934 [Amanita rubescens]